MREFEEAICVQVLVLFIAHWMTFLCQPLPGPSFLACEMAHYTFSIRVNGSCKQGPSQGRDTSLGSYLWPLACRDENAGFVHCRGSPVSSLFPVVHPRIHLWSVPCMNSPRKVLGTSGFPAWTLISKSLARAPCVPFTRVGEQRTSWPLTFKR